MRKVIFFIFLFLSLCAALPCRVFADRAEKEKPLPCASVIGVSGSVYAQRSASAAWEKADVCLPLYLNDKLQTQKSSYCVILFNDGSQVKINELTALIIKAVPKTKQKKGALAGRVYALIKILAGEIWAEIKPQKEKEASVETPCVKATVKGTEFDLKFDPAGKTTLTVAKGAVLFANNFGSSIVKTSQQSYAGFDTKPSVPVKVNAENIIKWTNNARVFTSIKLDPKKNKQYCLGKILNNSATASDRLNLSYIYISEGDLKNAQKQLTYIIQKMEPKNADALIALGIVQSAYQNTAKAKELFNRALKINPNSTAALQNMGFIYETEKNYTQALQVYKKVQKINPKDTQVLINCGVLLYKTGKTKPAIDTLRKAAKTKDKREKASAFYNLAKIYFETKDYKNALSNIKTALWLSPDDFLYEYLAQRIYLNISAAKTNKDEAAKILNEALKTLPDNYEILTALGKIYLEENKYSEAFDTFNKILKNNPYDGFTCFYLGEIYEKHFKDSAKACEYYKKAMKYFQTGDNKNNDAYNQIKKVLYRVKSVYFASMNIKNRFCTIWIMAQVVNLNNEPVQMANVYLQTPGEKKYKLTPLGKGAYSLGEKVDFKKGKYAVTTDFGDEYKIDAYLFKALPTARDISVTPQNPKFTDKITVKWQKVKGAAGYFVTVRDSDGEAVFDKGGLFGLEKEKLDIIKETTVEIPAKTLLPDAEYFIEVYAADSGDLRKLTAESVADVKIHPVR